MKRLLKKGLQWAKKYYLLIFLIGAVCFVMAAAAYKLLIAKPTYIYAKVKVGQGYWWATTSRPNAWFVDAIKNAAQEKPLSNRPKLQLVSLTYYPYYGTGQFDIYAVLKLNVTRVGEGKYSYERSTIGVGSPIDLEFNTVQFGGTIIALSEKPLVNTYVEKTVTLTKKNVFPWEYDEIIVGDSSFNGETVAAHILSKDARDTTNLIEDIYGNYPVNNEPKKYITVKVKLKGKMVNNQFFYSEEQVVIPGRALSLATPNFIFNDYTVAKVE